jgi:hypothetical protein
LPSPEKPDENILTLSVSANSGKNILAEYNANTSDFFNDDRALDWHKFTLEFTTRDNWKILSLGGWLHHQTSIYTWPVSS